MINIKNLCFGYGDTLVIDHLNMFVGWGEIAALLGASGSGKSTLFQLITGLRQPHCGKIEVGAAISYMMQDDLLLDWRTVLGNVLLASELDRIPVQKKRAIKLIEDVGLKGYEKHYPDQLSGGMRQRVALARALMFDRPTLLLDEPFAAVDKKKRTELYALVKELKEKYQLTILFITHEENDAMELADRVYSLDGGRVCEMEAALC